MRRDERRILDTLQSRRLAASRDQPDTPAPSVAEAAEPVADAPDDEPLRILLQSVGDRIADLFEQLERGGWRDDHGHLVTLNVAMIGMTTALEDIMRFRTDHLGYPSVLPPAPAEDQR